MSSHAQALRVVKARTSRFKSRRASLLLEFALILPVIMFIILFTVDIGSMVLIHGAMQDATYSSARSGAQVGGAGLDGATGAHVCGKGPCSLGSTYNSLTTAMSEIPGGSHLVAFEGMSIVDGDRCTANAPDNDVVIKVSYKPKLLTPGLPQLIGLFQAKSGDQWTMTATAVARCEVVR